MGIVQKHSVRYSIIYYLGVILGYINTVLLFPNILSPNEFGLTRILLSVAIVISQISQLGSTGMIIRYYPVLKEKIFSVGVIVCTAGLVIVLGIILLVKPGIVSLYIENSKLFTDYFLLLIPFSIAMVYYNLFDAFLRVVYRNSFSTFSVNIFLRLIWLGLILLFKFQYLNFNQFIYLYVLSYALIALMNFIYIKVVTGITLTTNFDQKEKDFFYQIRSFNLFTLLAGLSSFLINKIDIIMLGSMQGLEVLGVYAIAAYMGMVIRVPASSIARTAPVLVVDAFKRNNIGEIGSLYKKSAMTQMLLSAAIFIIILVNYKNITYLLPEAYSNSFTIFLSLGLMQVVDSSMGINGFIMINSKYYKTETFFSFFLLIITIITNYFLIPIYGANGAAVATLMSVIIYNLMRLIFIKIKLKIQPYTYKTLIGILICSVTLYVGFKFPHFDHFIADSIMRTLFVIICFTFLIYFSKISLEINKAIVNVIKSINHKK